MKLIVVVPAYNYIEGIVIISKWININLSKVCDEYKVIIYDDGNFADHVPYYTEIAKFKNFHVLHSDKNACDLRTPYAIASDAAKAVNYDAVLTIEHDCVPKLDTLTKMIKVFNNPHVKPLASVSPMFTWNNTLCYPVSAHWHTDGDSVVDGKVTYPDIGTVRIIGAPGAPFLFTLWEPNALNHVFTDGMPKMVRLDSEMGKLLYSKGYYSLRLTDCSIEHTNGGKKSWKIADRYTEPTIKFSTINPKINKQDLLKRNRK